MKKISPVTIAASLLAILLVINAILLATRKPSASAGGTEEAPAQGVVRIGGSPNQAPGHFRLTDISYHDREKGFALDADFTGQNIVFPEGYKGIAVSPAVEGGIKIETRPWWYRSQIVLKGDFAPETMYTIRVPAGLSDDQGNALARDAVFSARVPPMYPGIDFRVAGMYLPSGGSMKLPVKLCNASKITYKLRKNFDNNLNISKSDYYSWYTSEYLVDYAESTREYSLPRNKKIDALLDIREIFAGRDIVPGMYRLETEATDSASGRIGTDGFWFIVSDIAVQTALDEDGRRVAVFARGISDDSPVANAEVTVLSKKNQVVAEGRTDAAGTALLKFRPEFDLAQDTPKSIMVRSATDMTFEELDRKHEIDAPRKGVGPRAFTDAPEAFVFAERGIYRPGERIFASAFVRKAVPGATEAVPDAPVVFVLKDPNDAEVARAKAATDAHGFAEADFELGKGAMTGTYSIECGPTAKDSWGAATALVSAFVPDQIKVSLTSSVNPGECVYTNQPVKFYYDARYYFGKELLSGRYNLSVDMAEARLPEHMAGWTIGANGKKSTPIGRINGSCDSTNHCVSFLNVNPPVSRYCPLSTVARITVTPEAGRSVSAECAPFIFHPTPEYIGIRQRESTDDAAHLEACMLPAAAGGNPAMSTVSISLERIEWSYELIDNETNWQRRWTEKRTPLPELARDIMLTGEVAAIDFPGLEEGHYALSAASGEMKTDFEFWHYAGEGGARAADPKIVAFKLDRNSYKPGETARISFAANGDGEAFVVCGERKIDANAAFPVHSGENSFEFQVPATAESARYFFGVTIVSRENGGLMRQFGFLALPVDQSHNRMSVGIDAPELVEPESEIEVALHLRDADGAPVSGLARVYAVDEGILALTDYKDPAPFDFFYGARKCGFKFFDLYDDIIPDLAFMAEGHIGGDAYAGGWRPDMKTEESAVVVARPIEVDATGDATVRLRLPRHTGAMRIIAVAAGKTALGTASREITMRDKATVLASAPRAVAPGDEFEISCLVFNHDFADGAFDFSLALPEGLAPADGSPSLAWSGAVAVGASTGIVARVRAGDVAGFTNMAVTNALAIGGRVFTGETFVAVRPKNPPMTKTETFVVKPGETFVVSSGSADDWLPGASAAVTVAPHPATGLGDAFEWLNDYPYGCLEQTTSTAFPLLALDDLAKAGMLDPEIAETAKWKVDDAAARIAGMALGDGSFSKWPGGTYAANPFACIYATHFLLEANRAGLTSIKPGQDTLSYIARKFVFSSDNHNRIVRAYAAYVEVLAGKGDQMAGGLRNILLDETRDEATWIAAAAMAKAGYTGEAAAALREFIDAPEAVQCDKYDTLYLNEASLEGMLLYTLIDVIPDQAKAMKLATRIAGRQRNDGSAWGTTHANAWAILGLARFCSLCPPSDVVASWTTSEGVEQAIDLPATGSVHSASFRLDYGSAVIRNSGKTPLYARVRTTGIPRATPADKGTVKMTREFLDIDGKPISGPVRHGDLVEVRITIENGSFLDDAVLCDLLPGGFEIEDGRLATRTSVPPEEDGVGKVVVSCLERGDDRFLCFADIHTGKHVISYRVRAVTPGRYAIPPCRIECMYDPDLFGTFAGAGAIEIVR